MESLVKRNALVFVALTVAVLAMLTWYLANMPEDLQRLPPGAD